VLIHLIDDEEFFKYLRKRFYNDGVSSSNLKRKQRKPIIKLKDKEMTFK
jgi:hypothetical protein